MKLRHLLVAGLLAYGAVNAGAIAQVRPEARPQTNPQASEAAAGARPASLRDPCRLRSSPRSRTSPPRGRTAPWSGAAACITRPKDSPGTRWGELRCDIRIACRRRRCRCAPPGCDGHERQPEHLVHRRRPGQRSAADITYVMNAMANAHARAAASTCSPSTTIATQGFRFSQSGVAAVSGDVPVLRQLGFHASAKCRRTSTS